MNALPLGCRYGFSRPHPSPDTRPSPSVGKLHPGLFRDYGLFMRRLARRRKYKHRDDGRQAHRGALRKTYGGFSSDVWKDRA